MKFICMDINIEVFYKLILSFWVCVSSHVQSSQNKKFTYLCNSPKNVGNKLYFLTTNKYENFLQIDNVNLDVHNLPSQITLNNKFAISLQYPKENVKDEIDVFPVD